MAFTFSLETEIDNEPFFKAENAARALSDRVGIAFKDLNPVFRREYKKYLNEVIARARRKHSTPWQPGKLPAGQVRGRLYQRSGRGMAELKSSVRVIGSALVEAYIEGPFYLATQEFGATITVKRANYLAIPLPDALDGRGIPLKRSVRDWKNTFVRPAARNGGYWVFQRGKRRGGKQGKPVALYRLIERVKIPERLGLRADINKTSTVFSERLLDELTKSINRRIKKRGL